MRYLQGDCLAAAARRLPVIGLSVATAAVVAQTIAYVIDAPAAGGEAGPLDWLSVAAVSAVAVAAGLRAAWLPDRRLRFALLAAIMAFLAIDDAFGLHERLTAAMADLLAVSGRGDVLFLAPYLPLLAVAFALLRTAARDAGRSARTIMRLGLALLIAGIVARVVAGLVSASGITLAAWEKTLGFAAMHDAELAAWLLLASGLASAVCATLAVRHTERTSAVTPSASSVRRISSS